MKATQWLRQLEIYFLYLNLETFMNVGFLPERFFWDEEQVQLRAERDLASKATMGRYLKDFGQ